MLKVKYNKPAEYHGMGYSVELYNSNYDRDWKIAGGEGGGGEETTTLLMYGEFKTVLNKNNKEGHRIRWTWWIIVQIWRTEKETETSFSE
jgi:hypothetical protein